MLRSSQQQLESQASFVDFVKVLIVESKASFVDFVIVESKASTVD